MKYGFVLPAGGAKIAAARAKEAEDSGWDGFFVWEPVWGDDAWVSLAAAAVATSSIRLGTMLTPVARMRPWKLASETASLDNLSDGRLILAVGLGAPDTGYESFGEVTDRRERAELLDEGLDILTGLWGGQPFSYKGKHYTVTPTDFDPAPPPVQQPRIPIWVVGLWRSRKSMARALRYDGLLPYYRDGEFTPEVLEEIVADAPDGYDVIVEGEETPGDDPGRATDMVRPWAKAGGTWWMEARWGRKAGAELDALVSERIRQGPPRG
jgi:alkanesulfonate monooxygenase SsuD/methylene tetrahydromethanopterin reductase-like flavin-dependent oxidoreductase (luciferase family)